MQGDEREQIVREAAGGPTSRFESRFPSTDAIVKEKEIRRINDAYNEQQRRKREAVRVAIMVALCVGAIVGGFILCKMMGWGEP